MNDTLTFTDRFADGSPDYSSPNRPGFRVLDSNDPNRIACNDAYEARRQDMDYRSKRRLSEDDKTDKTDKTEQRTAGATLSADQARALADAAWGERTKRMQNAWRNR
jgi:hypothetical protein